MGSFGRNWGRWVMGFELTPAHWHMTKLGELGEVNRGRSRHRPRDASHLYGGPYPFIQTGDIKSSGGRITSFTQTYSEDGLAQSRLWPAQTMCITIAANIAETALLSFPACFPDSVVGFIADENKCDVRFIEYVFRRLRQRIQSEATGSVQDNINLQTLARLSFAIPPLREQVAIADALGAFDDRINLLRQANTTLEAVAQALFKSWFVDFDPVHAKAEGREPEAMDTATAALFPSEFEDSELGPIPKGWRARPLDSIADYLNGLALQKFPAESENEFLPVIKIAQLRAGNTTGSDRASAHLKPEYVVHDGDVLFSWSGSLEVEFWCGGGGALNQHLFKVTSDEVPKWFYYLATRIHLPEFRRVAASKATTMGHIQRKHLAQAKVAVPPREVLAATTKIIEPLLDRRITNSLQMRELSQLRDTLLPRLISGKLRLPKVTEAVEAALA